MLAFFFLHILVLTGQAAPVDRVAAVVNDEVIALSEIYDLGQQYITTQSKTPKLRREAEHKVLDSLISRLLVKQEMIRLGMDVTDEELKRSIKDVARQNKLNMSQFRTEIERNGITWQQYQLEMRENIRQMKFNRTILQPRISVDENALQDAYKRSIQKLAKVVELGALYVAAARKAKLQTAYGRLKKGESFAAIAKSLDESSFGKRGGKMGTFEKDQLRPDLNKAAFSTKVGELSAPVCDAKGCYLLFVFAKRAKSAPSFKKMRVKLLNDFYKERFEEELKSWTIQARRRSVIEIKLANHE